MAEKDEPVNRPAPKPTEIQPQTSDWPKPNTSDDNLITRGNNSEPCIRKSIEE